MIELIRVTKEYPRQRGVYDVSLRVDKGSWVVVVGHAGAGKSTLLKMVYAEEWPDRGEVIVGDYRLSSLREREVPRLRRLLGIVDEDLHLVEDRNAFENVALVGEILGWKRKKTKLAALRALNMVGLHGHLDSFPGRLSLGEQRRLAIARALVAEPFALIADEPLGNLDPNSARGIVRLLESIHSQGTAILMTTHQLEYFEGCEVERVELEYGRVKQRQTGANLDQEAP